MTMAWPGACLPTVSWVSRRKLPFSLAQKVQPWAVVPLEPQDWMAVPAAVWLERTSATVPLADLSVQVWPCCGSVGMGCASRLWCRPGPLFAAARGLTRKTFQESGRRLVNARSGSGR